MLSKRLENLFGHEGRRCCEKLFSLSDRLPKLFPKKILNHLSAFLSQSHETSLKKDGFTLCRIFFSLQHSLRNSLKLPGKIHFRILKIDLSTYGVSLAVNALQDHEILHEEHLLKSIKNIVPGATSIPGSYFAFQHQKICFFYIEIKKIRGGAFSNDEKEKLFSKLSEELHREIESLSHALFLPGAEEELFKSIHSLSRELKYVSDIPQVMINFIEYSQQTLKFLVIVLRVLKPNTLTIQDIGQLFPSLVHFSLENVFHFGKIRKKYAKEASVFTLDVKSSLFFQANRILNLRTARHYIAKTIESSLGKFRDYNGGFSLKEKEQLLAIKRTLAKKNSTLPFLEELFYGIRPIIMRALITAQTGTELAVLLQKLIADPLKSEERYRLIEKSTEKVDLVCLKTKEMEWKNFLPGKILAHSTQIGCTSLIYQEENYLCFFHQQPEKGILLEAIRKELAHILSTSCLSSNATLRIHFQGGDPPSLNPRLATDIHCHILSNHLFEGLMRLKGDTAEPAAAEKIEISPSGTHYTFYLRNSWWSNGEELSAYHFEKSWKNALMMGSTGYMYDDFFTIIKNARKARSKVLSIQEIGVKAKDSKTLFVELENPAPHFLKLISTPAFFPLYGDSEEPVEFNGPFTLAEWKRGEWISLSQNPFYWDAKRIKLGEIKIFTSQNPFFGYEKFCNEEIDLLGDPISPLHPKLLLEKNIQKNLTTKEISRIFWIHCNTRYPPLHHSDLRKALTLSIDRKRLVDNVFIEQIPHCSPLPIKYSYFKGSIEGNTALAESLFKKALCELKLERKAFPTLTILHSDLSFEKALMEELCAQWKEKLNIHVVPKQLPWSEFSLALEKGNFQLGGLFRRDLFNHPLFYLNFFKNTPYNPHGWDNSEYEQLHDRYAYENNSKEILKKLEKLLIREAPVIPLVNQKCLMLIHKRIKGLKWQDNGCLDLTEVWIDENTY